MSGWVGVYLCLFMYVFIHFECKYDVELIQYEFVCVHECLLACLYMQLHICKYVCACVHTHTHTYLHV